jgi:ABC-2 type transport system ATP-binding protein
VTCAVETERLTHAYGERVSLDDLSLRVEAGEVFGLLGPNGSGKTTLFRILSTLIPAPPGTVRILGSDPSDAAGRETVRRHIGVVFQSPSLDKQLTAEENLLHQGHLYGLRGVELRSRVVDALARFGLAERARERVETFSGGMRRRVEVAKGLLHRPRVLLMDEPSTGLDPAARIDLWNIISQVSSASAASGGSAGDGISPGGGVTVLVTTHLLEEAERCARLAILDRGRLLACDTPAALKQRIGGDVITVTTSQPAAVRQAFRDKLGVEPAEVDGALRLERDRGHEFVPQLIEAAPGLIDSVSVGKPTLEDVFIDLTGQRLRNDPPPGERGQMSQRSRAPRSPV